MTTLFRRSRAAAPALSAVLAVALALGAGLGAAGEQTDRTIYVSAVGGNGMPVVDPPLTANDFTVSEDNVLREISKVDKATEPVYYALLVDTSQSSTGDSNATNMVQYLRDALSGFVSIVFQAAPDSKIMLMEFGGAAVTKKEFTSNLADLDPLVKKVLPQNSEPVLNEALAEASKQIAKVPSRRRVILVVNREPTPEGSRLDSKLVAEEVRKSGASLWAISVRYGTRQDSNRDALLKGLAANSGGMRLTLPTPNPLGDYLRSVAANTIVQYAVTFKRPADAPPTKMTAVAISRPDVKPLTLLWSDK